MASLTDRVRTAVGMPSSTERALTEIVAELPVVPIEDLKPGLGAVRGTVVAHGGTVPEPLTTDDCVYAQYEIRERAGKRAGSVEYETVEGRVDAVQFRVEDDTGSVLVDPTVVEHPGPGRVGRATAAAGPLPFSDGATRAFGTGGDEEFEEIEERRLGRDETGGEAWVHPEIHVQSTVQPGDEVYVLGEFERSPDADADLAVAPVGGPFLFSDLSKSALSTALERQSGDVSGQFVRFLVFGIVAALAILLVLAIAVFVVTRIPV